MSDRNWYGAYAPNAEEPHAIFPTEQEARLYAYTYDVVRPVRLRLLAPLHPAEPCVLHTGDD